MKLVFLLDDDIDRHGECDCGNCNANGKSYGVAIFDADGRFKDGKASPEEIEAFIDATRDMDPLERVYGPSGEAAHENAKAVAEENGWEILTAK